MPLILLNKPYQVLSQFRDANGRAVLAHYIRQKGVYPAGRLDFTSEGLLLLTDDGRFQARIASPANKLVKRYWAQVEGEPTEARLLALQSGVELNDGPAVATFAEVIEAPQKLWPRNPPIRQRKSIPTTWLDLGITEGRNRQVRRMTAAVGLPTLRLIRHAIGPWTLGALRPGESLSMPNEAAWRRLS